MSTAKELEELICNWLDVQPDGFEFRVQDIPQLPRKGYSLVYTVLKQLEVKGVVRGTTRKECLPDRYGSDRVKEWRFWSKGGEPLTSTWSTRQVGQTTLDLHVRANGKRQVVLKTGAGMILVHEDELPSLILALQSTQAYLRANPPSCPS